MGYQFSGKFYIGIFLVLISLIIGKITTITFFFHFDDPFVRNISLMIYILSWPLLIIGIYWVGKEYAVGIRKYLSYRFYHQSIKEKTKKALSKTKEISRRVGSKTKERLTNVKTRLERER